MVLEILFWLSLLYFTQMLLFALSTWLSHYKTNRDYLPTVGVIIAARNEEGNIFECLSSMRRLDYPREKLEILVVDDHSSDRTAEIVSQIAREDSTVRLLRASIGDGRLRGKTNAVMQGIESSRGEIILFTDADCTVPEGWIRETVKYYEDDSVGLVAGFTELRADRIFEKMQALDWFALFSVAAAGIRLRQPFTAVGNNLSVRRAAYDAVGGYSRIPFSVTEDYALFHAITTQTEYKARFPLDRATLVLSHPCRSWPHLYHQKKRWFTGGRDMEARNLIFFAFDYLFLLLLVCSLVFAHAAALVLPGLLKIAADFLLLLPTVSTFRRWRLLAGFAAFEVYFTLYVLLFPPIVLTSRGIIWKERSFSKPPT